MNLFHLKYFVDAAEGAGVSHSARKNRVTQSAVSRAIAALEEHLGVELVLHRQNHFQLTEAGRTVLAKSGPVFAVVTDLKEAASEQIGTLRGPLRFGSNQSIASRLVAPALARMEILYPGIRPEIQLGNTDQIQRLLESRELDFGIVVDDGEVGRHFRVRKIYSDKLVVVRSPKYRKADPFENLIVSRIEKGGLSRAYFREYEKAYGKPIVPKIVVSSWQAILDFAIAEFGAALVPRFLCDEAIRTKKLQIVTHRVKPIPFDICTIVPRTRVLPENARALLECMGLKAD